MILKFTPDENRRKDEIFDLLLKLNEEQKEQREAEQKEYPLPKSATQYEGIEQLESIQERQAARDKIKDDLDEWDKNAPPEWKAQRQASDKLFAQRKADIQALLRSLYDNAEQRTMQELGGDPERILQHAKKQIAQIIENKIIEYQDIIANPSGTIIRDRELVSLGRDQWALDPDKMTESITYTLKRHYEALEGKNDQAGELLIDHLNSYIKKTLEDHPKIAKPGQGIAGGEVTCTDSLFIPTVKPDTYVFTHDKVSIKLWDNEYTEKNTSVNLSRKKARKQIDAKVSLSLIEEVLKGISTSMTPYDARVYYSILSLYLVGNEYISSNMIYQSMAGRDAKTTPNQANEINKSIQKFMGIIIKINHTEEMNARGHKGEYEIIENLLYARIVKRNLNGANTDCIQILSRPALYRYADTNDQIGRVPMKSLATPLNYSVSSIALNEYLLRRIHAMKGNVKERRISYETVYKIVLSDQAATASRMEKKRLRDYADNMLTYWTTTEGGNLIKGYDKYPDGKRAQGILIDP